MSNEQFFNLIFHGRHFAPLEHILIQSLKSLWVTEVVDIDSTSWKSKMTVNMHLFRGNKIVQMKK
jgi:hypothetical protein